MQKSKLFLTALFGTVVSAVTIGQSHGNELNAQERDRLSDSCCMYGLPELLGSIFTPAEVKTLAGSADIKAALTAKVAELKESMGNDGQSVEELIANVMKALENDLVKDGANGWKNASFDPDPIQLPKSISEYIGNMRDAVASISSTPKSMAKAIDELARVFHPNLAFTASGNSAQWAGIGVNASNLKDWFANNINTALGGTAGTGALARIDAVNNALGGIGAVFVRVTNVNNALGGTTNTTSAKIGEVNNALGGSGTTVLDKITGPSGINKAIDGNQTGVVLTKVNTLKGNIDADSAVTDCNRAVTNVNDALGGSATTVLARVGEVSRALGGATASVLTNVNAVKNVLGFDSGLNPSLKERADLALQKVGAENAAYDGAATYNRPGLVASAAATTAVNEILAMPVILTLQAEIQLAKAKTIYDYLGTLTLNVNTTYPFSGIYNHTSPAVGFSYNGSVLTTQPAAKLEYKNRQNPHDKDIITVYLTANDVTTCNSIYFEKASGSNARTRMWDILKSLHNDTAVTLSNTSTVAKMDKQGAYPPPLNRLMNSDAFKTALDQYSLQQILDELA